MLGDMADSLIHRNLAISIKSNAFIVCMHKYHYLCYRKLLWLTPT